MYYNVKLNNADPLDTAGWRVASIPVITHSQQNRDRYTIPLRDGEVIGSEIWRGNAFVTVVFHSRVGQNCWNSNFSNDTMDMRYKRLLSLLDNKVHLHILVQNVNNLASYDETGYFEILGWTITNETRVGRDYIRVEVQFEVEPFKYAEITESNPEYTTALSIENTGDESQPLYLISGINGHSSAFYNIVVNGNTFSVYIPNNTSGVYVDSRKQIAWYLLGIDLKKVETQTNGDFRVLRLKAHYTNVLEKGSGVSEIMTYPRFGVNI